MNDQGNPTTRNRAATSARPPHRALRDLDRARGGLCVLSALLLSRRNMERIIKLALHHRASTHYLGLANACLFVPSGLGRATLLQSASGWGAVPHNHLHAFLGAIAHCPDTLYRRLIGCGAEPNCRWGLSQLIVVRAGVLEELFYRGYAIGRLPSVRPQPLLGGNLRW